MSAPQRLSSFQTRNRFAHLKSSPTPLRKGSPDPDASLGSRARTQHQADRKARRAQLATKGLGQDVEMSRTDSPPTLTTPPPVPAAAAAPETDYPFGHSDTDLETVQTKPAPKKKRSTPIAPPLGRVAGVIGDQVYDSADDDPDFEPDNESSRSDTPPNASLYYSPAFSIIGSDPENTHSPTEEETIPAPNLTTHTPNPDESKRPAPSHRSNPPPRPKTSTPAPKLTFAQILREATSDASSDDHNIPASIRTRPLYPAPDDLPRLLQLAEAVDNATGEEQARLQASLAEAITGARPYVSLPEVTWVYFPRPPATVNKHGRVANALKIGEMFHTRAARDELTDTVTEWKNSIGRFEHAQLHGSPIVRIWLTTHAARKALTDQILDLGRFGEVTLLSAPIDPWDEYQYLDIPNLHPKDWAGVAHGFTQLGATPLYYGCRNGTPASANTDMSARFFFRQTFPQALKIGDKLPRQISYKGKLYLVFVKDYDAPRLPDARLPCAELLTLRPPTRAAPSDSTATPTSHPSSKRPKKSHDPPAPTLLPVSAASPASTVDLTAGVHTESSEDENTHNPLPPLTTTNEPDPPVDEPMEDTPSTTSPTFTGSTLWTLVPGSPPLDPTAAAPYPPARLFTPGQASYKTHGFPYTRIHAQYVTITKGKTWPSNTNTAVRRIQQDKGRLALSKNALTMQNLDTWLSQQAKANQTAKETVHNIEDTISPDLQPTHDAIIQGIHNFQPHRIVHTIQNKYVAAQASLAAIARVTALGNNQSANVLATHHFMQRALNSSSPTHCRAFNTSFQAIFGKSSSITNLTTAMSDVMNSELYNSTYATRDLLIGGHETALAWFELHLMAQAPVFFRSPEAHSLLAGGVAVNRIPAHNTEFLPSWLLQRILQSSLGRTIVTFMVSAAPDLDLNIYLLHELDEPFWTYPTTDLLTISFPADTQQYTLTWSNTPDYTPLPLTSLRAATQGHTSA